MHWYAVSVKPHHETHAQRSLQRLELETFCPQLKRARIVRRKHETTITPLFPGYLFARFHFQKDYFDGRFLRFEAEQNSAKWVHDLSEALGHWFLEWLQERKTPSNPSKPSGPPKA